MPDRFPSAPRAPLAVRLGAIAITVVALAVGFRTTVTSFGWVGRVFPGFVLLENGVIASVGLAHWSGSTVPGLYQSEVMAVDGHWVRSTPEVYRLVAEK